MFHRYGYTTEQEKKIDEIDEKLLQFEIERQQHLNQNNFSSSATPNSISRTEFDLEESSENTMKVEEGKLPPLSGKGVKNDEEKEINRPEKVIGDNYLKEQKMNTVRKKYSQQLDVLLTMVKSQVLFLIYLTFLKSNNVIFLLLLVRILISLVLLLINHLAQTLPLRQTLVVQTPHHLHFYQKFVVSHNIHNQTN